MPLEEPLVLGKILDMLIQYTNAIIVLHFLSEKLILLSISEFVAKNRG